VYAPNCIFRETVTITKPLTLDGRSGASIRGSDVLAGWSATGPTWVSQTTVPAFDMRSSQGYCADGTNMCNWPEQVFLDGRPLTQVAAASAPASGQFTLDGARHVVLADNPAGHVIEVSTRTRWVDTQSDNVTIQNFTFWHAANAAETGAIGNQNRNSWILQDSRLYYAHGGIVSIGGATNSNTLTQVLRNTIGGSGYEGLNGYLNTNTLIQANTIYNNNLAHFDINWSGGGVKVAGFTNLTFDRNEVYNNAGPGLWCDIACKNVTYSNNRVHDNAGAQIFFEISTGAKIFGNSVWNGLGDWPGIYVSSSGSAEVFNNTLARLGRGIVVYDQNRSDKPSSGTTSDFVHDNKFITSHSQALSLIWTDDGANSVTTPAYNNRGSNNSYYYATAEDSHPRFQWGGSQQFSMLTSFAATDGGAGSWYMSSTDSTNALASAGIPFQ
jgi:hypothetical protein